MTDNDGKINISSLDKAALLAALFNNSHAQGMGFLQPHAQNMTYEEAQSLLATSSYFDYVRGRVMKVDLGSDVLYTRLYDRDNGQGEAQRVIDSLRNT